MLQEKGRLVDFLMDDINAYSDAQVGAAARVVHAGCRGVLQDHFAIKSRPYGARGIDGAGSRRIFSRRVSAGRQDRRICALLRRACPPRLEDGYGEAAAVAARRRRPAARHRSRGGGSEMKPFGGGPTRPDPPDRDHQDASFHDSSLQSRHRPRHQQLRDGAERSRRRSDRKLCRSPRSWRPTSWARSRPWPPRSTCRIRRNSGRSRSSCPGQRAGSRGSSGSSPATMAPWCPIAS